MSFVDSADRNHRNNPILINRRPYGKHKGIRFTEIPLDYLQWLLTTKLDVDRLTRYGIISKSGTEKTTFNALSLAKIEVVLQFAPILAMDH